VWIVSPNKTVASRKVTLGQALGGHVEIIDGLQPGDRIAAIGATFLREGMRVRDLGDALGGRP
jgi:multidrug efflux system membrane fusion protein